MKKIVVLGKMLERGVFTLADIAQSTGVIASTVQTILNRCPGDWLNVENRPTGSRGGQPKLYRLTERGQAEIHAQLSLLQVVPPATRAAGVEPASLVLAAASVARLRAQLSEAAFDNDRLEFLRDEALGNLQWAANEADRPELALRIASLREEVLTLDIQRLQRRVTAFDRRFGAMAAPAARMATTPQAAWSRDKIERMKPGTPAPGGGQHSLLRTLFAGVAQQGEAAAVALGV